MRKFVLSILIITFLISNFAFVSLCEGMSTYENLCALSDDFIIRLKSINVSDEAIEKFLDDMDATVDTFQANIYAQDLDAYFITVLLQNMQKEEHLPILIGFDLCFQEEIAYMLNNKKVPDNMSNFKLIMFNDKLIFEEPDDTKIPDEEFFEETTEPNPPQHLVTYPFDDITEYTWAVESIMHLHKNGVVNGTGERIFSPEKPVTREEFIKMIVKALLKTDSVYDKEFGKKYEGKWYHSYMASAEFYALIQGIYDEGEFKEEVYITRQDMCTIAYRAALRADIKLPFKTYSTDFYDMNKISFYATEAIKELQEADIIHGTGNNMFEPFLTTTRAEAAKIVHKLMLLK